MKKYKNIIVVIIIVIIFLLLALLLQVKKINSKKDEELIINQNINQVEKEEEENQDEEEYIPTYKILKYTDDEYKRFEDFISNVKMQRKSLNGIWAKAKLELTTNLSQKQTGIKDTIEAIIDNKGYTRLVIDNQYLEAKYSNIYPNISDDGIDVICGARQNSIAQYIYVLNGDGSVTQVKILDEIEITKNYEDLECIVKMELRDSKDNLTPFVFYDINGKVYEF